MDSMNTKHSGFKIYTGQNGLISSDINVILISHAIYDTDTTTYSLVGKGDFQKRGGFLGQK